MAHKRGHKRAKRSKGKRSHHGHKTTFRSKKGNVYKLTKVASGLRTGRSRRAKKGRAKRRGASRRRK